MKTEEDEAFDDLARRQGMWGGGFTAKRQAAVDKLVEDLAVYGTSWSKDGERIDPTSVYLDEPAPNKKRPIESHYTSHVAYTRALEMYCDTLVQPAQEPVALVIDGVLVKSELPEKYTGHLYTTLPKREWVGLTDEEREGVAQDYSLTGLGYQSPFKAIETMLKEKNT